MNSAFSLMYGLGITAQMVTSIQLENLTDSRAGVSFAQNKGVLGRVTHLEGELLAEQMNELIEQTRFLQSVETDETLRESLEKLMGCLKGVINNR